VPRCASAAAYVECRPWDGAAAKGFGLPPAEGVKDMRAPSLLFIILIGLAMGIGAVRAEDEPKAYQCSFSKGTSWTHEGGGFKSGTPEALSFEVTNIDLDGQTASLVSAGHERAASLKIVRAINANHFLEVVNEGFLNLTTIYDKDAASGTYPAVHSRHFGIIGQPFFAQYAGTCTAK
jgi:hypothetical protein